MKKRIIILVVLLGLFFLASPLIIYFSAQSEIYTDVSDLSEYEVAIVFGAGIKSDGTPSDALKDRLISATELYNAGIVDKILVSGDNSFENYNEPEAMYEYLVGVEGIPADAVVTDYAGRRTYDTCVRANEVWGITEAVLVTQAYHLPRAIFTCNALGVDSVGYSASKQEYVFGNWYKVREVLAMYKAVLDVYLWGPNYIGGEQLNI